MQNPQSDIRNQRVRLLGHRVAWKCRRLPLFACCLLASLAGCGGSSDYVQVSGKVTYEDGSLIPVKGLQVVFYPQRDPQSHSEGSEAGKRPRVARAPVSEKDGTFDTATTYEYGDGVLAGKHIVILEDVMRKLPAEYTSVSAAPFRVDTKDSPFTFLVKKPKGRR